MTTNITYEVSRYRRDDLLRQAAERRVARKDSQHPDAPRLHHAVRRLSRFARGRRKAHARNTLSPWRWSTLIRLLRF